MDYSRDLQSILVKYFLSFMFFKRIGGLADASWNCVMYLKSKNRVLESRWYKMKCVLWDLLEWKGCIYFKHRLHLVFLFSICFILFFEHEN